MYTSPYKVRTNRDERNEIAFTSAKRKNYTVVIFVPIATIAETFGCLIRNCAGAFSRAAPTRSVVERA